MIYQMKRNLAQNSLLTTLLFLPFVKDKKESANVLKNDLILISRWAYNWKILFNPDPSKQAQDVIFSNKKQFQTHPTKVSPIFKMKEHLIKNTLE